MSVRGFLLGVITTLGVSVAPDLSSAQTPPPAQRAFVGITVGVNWDDRFSGSSDHIPGAVRSWGVTAGVESSSRSVHFEADISDLHTRAFPVQRFLHTGTTSGYFEKGHFYESDGDIRRRAISGAVLYGRRIETGHAIHGTWLIGTGNVSWPAQSHQRTTDILPDGSRVIVHETRENSSRHSHAAIVLGLDLEIPLGHHLSIVPNVRLLGFPLAIADDFGPDLFVVRPRLEVHWRF